MKNLFYLFIIMISCVNSYAQFGAQQVISTNIGGARSVFASDIDGDGDMDVLSASNFDDKVSWFENLDGFGSFGIEQIIDNNLPNSTSVIASDLDGDGDMDVVSVSWTTDRVTWYENLDGLGSFGSLQTITSNADGVLSISVADFDGDGDNDVISASHLDNKIAWYKNDGFGNFGAQLIITTNALSTRQVIASDVDGDDDIDVVYASTGNDKIIWHENMDGLGNFGGERIVSTNVDGIISVFTQDIDGDNDMDIVSASFVGEIAWHENTDGIGNFNPKQLISINVDAPRIVYAADLDNDNDIDVLSASQGDDKIARYENIDGLGTFSTQQIISTFPEIDGATAVIASDIDNDGDMDVVSASLIDAKIAWYENLTILGANQNTVASISIYPNPTNMYLNITHNGPPILKLEIFDVLGRNVLTTKEKFNQLDISRLKSGVLFVKIKTESGIVTKKIIKE